MKVYLAARYSRYPEMQEHARDLEALGFEVTSRWILGDHELRADGQGEADRWAVVWAEEDRQDLLAAGLVISFTEGADVPGRARGGRHVEFGMALETGKSLILVGPRENVFHHIPQVQRFDTLVECLKHLGEWSAAWLRGRRRAHAGRI